MNKEALMTLIAASFLLVTKVRLSTNPNAVVQKDGKFNLTVEKPGPDGKIRAARQYFVAEFADPENPFLPVRMRMVSQQYDTLGRPVWRVDPERIKDCVNKKVSGAIVTLEVEPYIVREGQRPVTSYSAAVLRGEDPETIFLNAGHRPIGCTRPLPPRFQGVGAVRPAGVVPDYHPETAGSEIVEN
jgi:hypothetical protein